MRKARRGTCFSEALYFCSIPALCPQARASAADRARGLLPAHPEREAAPAVDPLGPLLDAAGPGERDSAHAYSSVRRYNHGSFNISALQNLVVQFWLYQRI